jgi:hypothetical protein
MVLTNADKEIIIGCAKKCNVSSVYLVDSFDGALLGIDGVDQRLFFRFYGDLMRKLQVPVDVYDMSVQTLYSRIIEKEGLKIYG